MGSPEQTLRSVLAVGVTLGVSILVLVAAWGAVERRDIPRIDTGTMVLLEELFPGADRFEGLHPDEPPYSLIGAYREGERKGTASHGRGSGYGGPIRVLVAADREGIIIGVAVVEQSETPGLGDVIREESFLGQFAGKLARDPITIGDDLDNISGATLSARGTAEAVRDALEQKAPDGGERP
ncbi:MAG: FMN-binding protein [Spirochaetaceae bacterium]|nr:MAG: FMN-binding protein [Spirochaetaceae bacterium]